MTRTDTKTIRVTYDEGTDVMANATLVESGINLYLSYNGTSISPQTFQVSGSDLPGLGQHATEVIIWNPGHNVCSFIIRHSYCFRVSSCHRYEYIIISVFHYQMLDYCSDIHLLVVRSEYRANNTICCTLNGTYTGLYYVASFCPIFDDGENVTCLVCHGDETGAMWFEQDYSNTV
jgi:hypothetical protein